MAFVGSRRGAYIQQISYEYVGVDRSLEKRHFICIITGVCFSIVILILLMCWLFIPRVSCIELAASESWSIGQKAYCCTAEGLGCTRRSTIVFPDIQMLLPNTSSAAAASTTNAAILTTNSTTTATTTV